MTLGVEEVTAAGQTITMVGVLGLLIRQAVPWRTLTLQSRKQQRDELHTRIEELKEQHKECQDTVANLLTRIDELQNQLNNEARQRVQSEISLVNTLIQVVDAPQLRAILTALEARQVLLPEMVEGVGSDLRHKAAKADV